MLKITLLAALLTVTGCADAKSSSSSSSSRSSSYKSSGYKSSSSTRASVRPRSTTQSRPVSVRTTTSRCSGTTSPVVEYDWDDSGYEMKCGTGRKMNRFGRCECK